MQFKKILFLILLSISLCLIACEENGEVTIKLSGDSSVMINETISLSAKASDNSTDFDWDSSDESIATVSGGIVTGISEGTVTITVSLKSNSNIKATKEITVTNTNEEYNLSVSKEEVSLKVNESVTVNAIVTPSTELVWSSSDEKIAIVENGKITGLKAGNATITVSTKNNEKSLTIKVTVVARDEYTTSDLKNDLLNVKSEYISATSANMFIETSEGTLELIYNISNGKYENFKYAVKSNTNTISYVKDGFFYSEIEGSKKKTSLSDKEAQDLLTQYNASKFLEEVTSFYDEDEFYVALSKKQETNDYVEFDLVLNNYYGKTLNVNGVDSVTLKVSFENNNVKVVELIFITKDETSFVKLYYRGITKQDIDYPSDLDSYIE